MRRSGVQSQPAGAVLLEVSLSLSLSTYLPSQAPNALEQHGPVVSESSTTLPASSHVSGNGPISSSHAAESAARAVSDLHEGEVATRGELSGVRTFGRLGADVWRVAGGMLRTRLNVGAIDTASELGLASKTQPV